MGFTFELAAIPFEVEFRNVKVLRLTVYPDGRAMIAAPPGTETVFIKNFASSKIKWVEKHRETLLNHSKITGSLRNHSTMYVWGVPYELVFIEHRGNSKIVLEDGYMRMYISPLSPKAKKQEILDRWYRRILREKAPPIIEHWETITGIRMNKLYIRKMKSHWGSCNCGKKTMRLNSELAKRSPECLEYVIVHEMLHIIEKGHNRKFYRELEKYIPNWKTIRKNMNNGQA
jgi:predicted metal-dependent hydrolase